MILERVLFTRVHEDREGVQRGLYKICFDKITSVRGVERDRVEVAVALFIQSTAKGKIEFRIIGLDGFIRTSIDAVVLVIKVGVLPEAEDKRGFDLFTVCIDFM